MKNSVLNHNILASDFLKFSILYHSKLPTKSVKRIFTPMDFDENLFTYLILTFDY